MTDTEQRTLDAVYRAIVDLKSDSKDLIRDLKDDLRDVKEELRELKTENTALIEMIEAELDDSEPATIVDKALALAEKQPELANKLIDKFGDKINIFLDSLGKGE